MPIKRSIRPDYVICLEDGKKFKMLKRHLRNVYDLSPDEYRRKWGLSSDYPMVAPKYAARRSEIAKIIGLGRKPGQKVKGKKVRKYATRTFDGFQSYPGSNRPYGYRGHPKRQSEVGSRLVCSRPRPSTVIRSAGVGRKARYPAGMTARTSNTIYGATVVKFRRYYFPRYVFTIRRIISFPLLETTD